MHTITCIHSYLWQSSYIYHCKIAVQDSYTLSSKRKHRCCAWYNIANLKSILLRYLLLSGFDSKRALENQYFLTSFVFYCTEEQLTVDSDDEYQYEEVPIDEIFIGAGMSINQELLTISFNRIQF